MKYPRGLARLITSVVMIGLVFTSLQAHQVADANPLYQPSEEEFLKAVPAIAQSASTDYARYGIVGDIVSEEIIYRYFRGKQATDFPLIQRAFARLIGLAGLNSIDLRAWTSALIQAWLYDNKINLDEVSRLQIGDYSILVNAEDFKMDSGHEWILEVHDNSDSFSAHMNYVVLERAGEQMGSYRVVEIPLPWFSSGFSYGSIQVGTVATYYLGDITGEGQPDWLLTIGGILSNGGYHINYGWLEILTWRDDKMVSIAPDELMDYDGPSGGHEVTIIPPKVSLRMTYPPNAPSAQIHLRRDTVDNWGCQWSKTRTFAWNGASYYLAATSTVFPDTSGCAWRNADLAMSRNDFKQAIAYYEAGLNLAGSVPANQYERARLAIAYSIIGQPKRADALIDQLVGEKPASTLMAELISALDTARVSSDTPVALCTAAFQVFVKHNEVCEAHFGSDSCNNWPWPYPGIIGGIHDDVAENVNYTLGGSLPIPELAGCNPSALGTHLQPPATFVPYTVDSRSTSSQSTDVDSWYALRDAQTALFSGHPSNVFVFLNKVHDPILMEAVNYLKALAYEFMHQPDSAAEYFTTEFVNGDPISPWAMLARLHLPTQP